MKPRYVVAPQAARDLVQIWRYAKNESSQQPADRVESVIRSKFAYLSEFPGGGHWRRDRTLAEVRFFPSTRTLSYIGKRSRLKSWPSCTASAT